MEGYPKTKFHKRGGGSITVHSAAQEKALGNEWVDNKVPEPVKVESKPERGEKTSRRSI